MNKKTAEYKVSLCPFLQLGINRCYHMQPDSRKVYSAMAYCQTNHLDCDIYNELKDSEIITDQILKEEVK